MVRGKNHRGWSASFQGTAERSERPLANGQSAWGKHISKRSMKENLNPLAISIRKICEENNTQLQVKWVRRDLNKIADKLSRSVDLDDWGIKQEVCTQLQAEWDCHCTGVRFASSENRKLLRYNSRFANSDSEGINAFAQSWTAETNWTVPPPHLILQVIKHIQKEHARGILIIPNWCSSRYWPFIFASAGRLQCIQRQKLFRNGAESLVQGKQPHSIFTPENFKSSFLALLYDAREG